MRKLITLVFLISFSLLSIANIDNDKDGNKIKPASSNSTFTIIQSVETETLTLAFNVTANVSAVSIIDNSSNIIYEAAKPRGAANILDIPLENMEPGTYFIRAQTENGVRVERIIIQ